MRANLDISGSCRGRGKGGACLLSFADEEEEHKVGAFFARPSPDRHCFRPCRVT